MDKKRVLIVDDVPSNLHLLTSLLKNKYIVSAATNGERALELINTQDKPDIILLDVFMPDMNGFEVCEKLRSNKDTRDIPVIFVSSMDDEESYDQIRDCGDNIGFIKKPIMGKDVYDMIEKFVDNNSSIAFDVDDEDPFEEEKFSILVVDDTPENIKVIVEILKEDYKVSVSTSGENALKLLDNGLQPDLILLDVLMPELDGFQICEMIKSQKEHKDIPVVFLTILENEEDIVKGFELGAVDYVTKPVEPVVLKARINTHLKLKRYHSHLLDNLKKKEEILVKQSKMAILGEMFENITHQWKQPLSVISLTGDTIKMYYDEDVLDDKKLNSAVDTIKESTLHLSDTVDGFRDFLKEDVQRQYFNVKEVVEKSLKLLSAKFKNQDITIDQNDLSDIEILAYKNDLIQVLMNLLNNAKDALEHTESNRLLRVSTEKIDTNVIIRIIDNGGGIKDQNMDKLFKKYFTTKSKDKGTGIGLYMSKTLVENHLHGLLKGYNYEDGACFEIILPIE